MKPPKPRISEKVVERNLCSSVKAVGGLAVKLLPFQFAGLPDRLILLPGGRMCFVETKSGGKGLSKIQQHVKKLLTDMGFTYFTIDSADALDHFKMVML